VWLLAHQRVSPRLVRLRFLHVVAPRRGYSLGQRGIHGANDAPRHSHDQRACWNSHAFGHDCAGCNDTAATDHDTVQKNATHRNQTIILYRAAVQNYPVPNTDSLTDMAWDAFIYVNYGAILDVRLRSNHNWRHVASEHRAIPDTRILTQCHVPHDRGG
jgi:hypothetical protein